MGAPSGMARGQGLWVGGKGHKQGCGGCGGPLILIVDFGVLSENLHCFYHEKPGSLLISFHLKVWPFNFPIFFSFLMYSNGVGKKDLYVRRAKLESLTVLGDPQTEEESLIST